MATHTQGGGAGQTLDGLSLAPLAVFERTASGIQLVELPLREGEVVQARAGKGLRLIGRFHEPPQQRVETSCGGGAGGGATVGAWVACSQASQGGLRASPGKGLGAVERFRGGVTGVGGIGRAAAGSDGHHQESMRNNHTKAISASWEK